MSLAALSAGGASVIVSPKRQSWPLRHESLRLTFFHRRWTNRPAALTEANGCSPRRVVYIPLTRPTVLPWGSVNMAMDGPPGMSVGSITFVPPSETALSRLACRSSVLT